MTQPNISLKNDVMIGSKDGIGRLCLNSHSILYAVRLQIWSRSHFVVVCIFGILGRYVCTYPPIPGTYINQLLYYCSP